MSDNKSKYPKWILTLFVVFLVLIAGVFGFQFYRGKILRFAQDDKSVVQSANVGANFNSPLVTDKPSANLKLGVVVSLSGEAASYGQNILAGATLAVNEFNQAGGLSGKKVEIDAQDDKCDPSESLNATKKLLDGDNVDAIVGFVCSKAASSALPATQTSSTPVVISSASTPNLIKPFKNVYRIYPSDALAGKKGAEVAKNQLKVSKVAIINSNDIYGTSISQIFKDSFIALGGEVVSQDAVNSTETDFSNILTKIKSSQAQAIYMPVLATNAVPALKQAKDLGVTLPIIGDSGFTGDDSVVKSGFAEGAIAILSKDISTSDFKTKIKGVKELGGAEVSVFAATGYDSAKAILEAWKMTGSADKTKVIEALKSVKFQGASNLIRFDVNREILNPQYDVKIVRNNKLTDI
jgi:branched-chain amino acid transport system substrate-binding protein